MQRFVTKLLAEPFRFIASRTRNAQAPHSKKARGGAALVTSLRPSNERVLRTVETVVDGYTKGVARLCARIPT